MRVAILILPTLLAACFVLALSTEARNAATPPPSRAEIRELRQLLARTSARLQVVEPQRHNFLPRGASVTDYPSHAANFDPQADKPRS